MKSKAFWFSLFIVLFIFLACSFPGAAAPPADPPTNTPDLGNPPTDPVPQTEPSDTPSAPEDTPEPSDAPEPSATSGLASGTILYETNFDSLSGWSSFPWWQSNVHDLAGADFKTRIANYVAEIRAGTYHFEVPKKYTTITSIYAAHPGADDVSIIADSILIIDRPWTFISLVCRYQENVGWYEFYIQSDGQWGIRKISYVNGTLFDTKNLIAGFATAISYGEHGALNELQATCLADDLVFSVNGVVVGAVKDTSYTTGLIGVGVAAGEQGNSLAAFDRLRVEVP